MSAGPRPAVGRTEPEWGMGVRAGPGGGIFEHPGPQCRESPPLESGSGGPCVLRAPREEMWRGLRSAPGLSEGDGAGWEEGTGQRSEGLMSPQGDGGACSLKC